MKKKQLWKFSIEKIGKRIQKCHFKKLLSRFKVTAYLPAMQFSFVPWHYDEKVVEIAREYVRIHEKIVTPIVLQAANEYYTTGKANKFSSR